MADPIKRKQSPKQSRQKNADAPSAKPEGVVYDPATFEEFTARLEATRGERARLEEQRAVARKQCKRKRLFARILHSLAHGTPTMKVRHQGELAASPRWYAQRLRRLAALWHLCDGLAGHSAPVIHDVTAGEPRGYRAGRTLLGFALAGASAETLERTIRDALDGLRKLRDEGLMSAINDLPDAIAEYFDQLEHWYHTHGCDLSAAALGPITPTVYGRGPLGPIPLHTYESWQPVPEPSDPLEEAMNRRGLSERQREVVRQAAEALSVEASPYILSSELKRRFGIPHQTVERDCRDHTGSASRRGRQGAGRVAYEREYLRAFVAERWSPRV